MNEHVDRAGLKKNFERCSTSKFGNQMQSCTLFDTRLLEVGVVVEQFAYDGMAIPFGSNGQASIAIT